MAGKQPSTEFYVYFKSSRYLDESYTNESYITLSRLVPRRASPSATRLSTLNLRNARKRWSFTVPSEIPSCQAMSLLRAPVAAHWATSRSRGERAFTSPKALELRPLRVVIGRGIHGSSAKILRTQETSIDAV